MKLVCTRATVCISMLTVACLIFSVSCTKHSAERAGQGAAMGGAVGAVGGFVTGLVFGGNAMESAARGAVYGASTGATAGAITGAQEDKAKKQQQTAESEKMKKRIGEDAYNGAVALVQCKYEVALANARVAAGEQNKEKALAGLWIEALTYADKKQEDKAREMFPRILEKDDKISTDAQAEARMRQGMQKLMDLREEHGLPTVCP